MSASADQVAANAAAAAGSAAASTKAHRAAELPTEGAVGANGGVLAAGEAGAVAEDAEPVAAHDGATADGNDDHDDGTATTRTTTTVKTERGGGGGGGGGSGGDDDDEFAAAVAEASASVVAVGFAADRRRAYARYFAAKATAEAFPLHAAARRGRADVLRELLSAAAVEAVAAPPPPAGSPPAPAAADALDAAGRTALRYAGGEGHTAAAQVLVERKASVDLPDKTTLTTPLMAAARGGHAETVRVLLLAQADVTIEDRAGETALVKARLFLPATPTGSGGSGSRGSRGGHAGVVELLMQAHRVWPELWTEGLAAGAVAAGRDGKDAPSGKGSGAATGEK